MKGPSSLERCSQAWRGGGTGSDGVTCASNWRILMSSKSFDLITLELLKQQRTMEILQAENRELRQQLTDLRTGRGIFIEINGKRFALNTSIVSQTASAQTSSSALQEADPSIADEPTTEISTVLPAEAAES